MFGIGWVKDLGKTGKVLFAISGGFLVVITAYGVCKLYKNSIESRAVPNDDEEEGIPEKKILVLGLEGCGKTRFLSALCQPDSTGFIEKTKPTEGFFVVCLNTDGLNLNIWEIGGSKKDYWPNFLSGTNLLVYVVDSTNPAKFEQAKECLHNLLSEYQLHGIPLLLVTTKNDLLSAKSLDEVVSAMGLDQKLPSESKVKAVAVQVKNDGSSKGLTVSKEMILQLCN